MVKSGRKVDNSYTLNDSQSTHDFGHRFLAEQSLAYPKEIYLILSSSGGVKWLDRTWAGLRMQGGTPIPPSAVRYRKIEPDFGLEGFLITFPEPKAVPEAFLSALVFRKAAPSGQKAVVSARYFTLELGHGLGADSEARLYFFCEWTKGGHINYGQLASPDEREFLVAVRLVHCRDMESAEV